MEKNEIRICSNTMLKNKLKIDEKPKCKIGGYKIPRVKHRCLCTHTRVCVCVCVCAESCPTLCSLLDCSPPGSCVHGIFQIRILEWVAISYPTGSSPLRDQIHISCLAGSFFTTTTAGKSKNIHGILFDINAAIFFLDSSPDLLLLLLSHVSRVQLCATP